jgi:hypothetical protein
MMHGSVQAGSALKVWRACGGMVTGWGSSGVMGICLPSSVKMNRLG